MAEKRDAVCDALEGFLNILNKRTGRAHEEKGPPKDGLLVLIRKKKKKGGVLAGGQAAKAEASTKPILMEK